MESSLVKNKNTQQFPRLMVDPSDNCVIMAIGMAHDGSYYGMVVHKGESMLEVGLIRNGVDAIFMSFSDKAFTEVYDGQVILKN